jgi:four helix bundle protein
MASTYAKRLTVYQDALNIVREMEFVAKTIPYPQRHLRDQLRRAASSIVLNLAEGADEFKPAEKARIYRLARRSASECVGVLDVLEIVLDGAPKHEREHRQLALVIQDISSLVASMERRASASSSQSGAQEDAQSVAQ